MCPIGRVSSHPLPTAEIDRTIRYATNLHTHPICFVMLQCWTDLHNAFQEAQ